MSGDLMIMMMIMKMMVISLTCQKKIEFGWSGFGMATVGSFTIPTNSSMMICRQPGTKVSACSDDLPSICQENTMDLVQAARLF